MRITNAALKMPNGCIITMERPNRHHNILNTHKGVASAEQGFITDEGNFVGREEALQIAKDANQIVRRCGGDDLGLFSENLW